MTCPMMYTRCHPFETFDTSDDVEACMDSIRREGSIPATSAFAERFQHPLIPCMAYGGFPSHWWSMMDALDAKEAAMWRAGR